MDFRQVMTRRRVHALLGALSVLAGVTRHEQDPHVVRLTVTSAEDGRFLGAINLSLLPLTELGDAARARSTDISRAFGGEVPTQPADPGLRLVQPTNPTDTPPPTALQEKGTP